MAGSRRSGTCSPSWSCSAPPTRCDATSMCGSRSSTCYLTERGQLWLDLIGAIVFLLPVCLLLVSAVLAVLRPVLRRQRMVAATPAACCAGRSSSSCRSASPCSPCRACRRSSSASRALKGYVDDRRQSTRDRCSDHARTLMPPLMFGGLVLFMLVGYPVAFSLAALGIALRLRRDRARLLHHLLSAGDPAARVRQRAVERPAARGAVLHLHGRDPRALRPGRGHARFDGPAVRHRSAAGSATRSSSWASSWARSPARWRPRSSRWR